MELHSLTQDALAQRLGIGLSNVANKLLLLELPQEVQDALLQKQITERHARSETSVVRSVSSLEKEGKANALRQ